MTLRLPLIAVMLAGCGTQAPSAKVSIVFENETQTKCVKVSAKRAGGSTVNGQPAALNRDGKDRLVIAIGQTPELSGEVLVTVKRFAAVDCPGTEFDSETKPVTLAPGVAMLEFRYGVASGDDGGSDGGLDGGGDGGCDTSMCRAAGDCETGLPSCACTYQRATAGTPCSTGVCDPGGACVANFCAALPDGTACDAGLSCLSSQQCSAGRCIGNCTSPVIGTCQQYVAACANATDCQVTAGPNGTNCASGRKCLDGTCAGWMPFGSLPPNLRVDITDVPYPDAGWALASPDGGLCNTIVSTSGAVATVVQGDCGNPPIFATVDDAGVSVLLMTSLTVGPNARVHFVGDRPAQLIVLGDATISGMLSVAPFTTFPPAGTQPASCTAVGSGTANDQGGGGAGFGDRGGNGGSAGGVGGVGNGATMTPIPLRGGCAGGSGFRPGGQIDGGRGGGALELIVTGAFTIPGGAVTASGEGGAAGAADNHGGGGGGSGGTVIIQATSINLTGGAVTANGGGGGEGGDNGQNIPPGPFGSIDGGNRVPTTRQGAGGAGGMGGARSVTAGENGADNMGGNQGSGGGGASVGVIFLRGYPSCTLGTGAFSPGGVFTCN